MVLRVQREHSRRSEVQAILSATPQKGEWYVRTEGREGMGECVGKGGRREGVGMGVGEEEGRREGTGREGGCVCCMFKGAKERD